jgi:hypothetical protein
MKYLFFAALMLAGSYVSAQVGSRSYIVMNGHFNPEHLTHFSSGSMLLDYDKKTLSLEITGYRCPEGRECGEDLSKLSVSLPIVSIKTDDCGIRHIQALRDARPADGDLQILNVEDASQMTCPTFVRYIEQASYRTNYFDRLEGKEVNAESTMNVELRENTPATYQFSEGRFIEGFPGLEIPVGGKLEISESMIQMMINKGLNCREGSPCPAYMPMPMVVHLPVLEILENSCGRHLVAKKETYSQVGDHTTEELVIADYTNSVCKIVRDHLIESSYSEIFINNKGLRHEKKAQFSFDLPRAR